MEKSIIVCLFNNKKRDFQIQLIVEELKLLTESAGGKVVDSFIQRRNIPDKRYLIGKGKANEIKDSINLKDIELLIFHNQLSNIQQRNLENLFKIKIIDRTRLILDVFATRARSLEGKLQVELAQLLYMLPRLTGWGIELSRLGGGIGTRGPGETKLEIDRRRIKKRISVVKKRLGKVIKDRDIQRKNRKKYPIPIVSLVGYTSAGKSTLFKILTGTEVPISQKFFSTLDPLLRRVDLFEISKGYYFLLSDTVGFIRQMPRELFESFKATLEEIIQADIIFHVVDIANPDYLNQIKEVQKVLTELNIPESKVITIYNKIDLLNDYEDLISTSDFSRIYISAKENLGILNIKKTIFERCFVDYDKYLIEMPRPDFNHSSISKWAIILGKNLKNNLVELEILCTRENMIKFKEKYGGFLK